MRAFSSSFKGGFTAKILQKKRKILRAFALCFLSRAVRSAKELRSKEKKRT
jgi:SOS response regulatory protein OraA/RecX